MCWAIIQLKHGTEYVLKLCHRPKNKDMRKSMFTLEAARGQGVGAALLRQLEDTAREHGLTSLKLETGDTLHAAHRLYERNGFTFCGPFGDYKDIPESLFMVKSLETDQ